MNKQDLIDFEEEIAKIYETGVIRGPIHLRSGSEDYLINLFKSINKEDYVFATWSNHREALLKGIPPTAIKQRILEGHSMAMNFPEYNFYTSAIVGGICPIATGVAYALKKQNKKNRVYIFIGDMAFLGGAAHEAIQYSAYHDLPISWIIGDNNQSVSTNTSETWGITAYERYQYWKCEIEDMAWCENCRMEYYSFKNKFPHSGVGTFISF